ncbi:MAG: single-stranded-DNA-specific exonuclease RecJ [Patescibacteria group bacterium]|nr:single-stranded-DNA-specific exonuclease RecJ [Patescibacteria group bacterium]
MKKWEIIVDLGIKNKKFKTEEIVEILFKNRGIKTKTEKDAFLNPKLSDITLKNLVLNEKELKKAVRRINTAIKKREKIIIYGDYDVDGICASAILWETLKGLDADVMPFIPSRFEQGYGLSKEGIDSIIAKEKVGLIITVDNGIVASQAVEYANKKEIDVIITDHHVPSKKLPKALAIVHTTKLCGAGVAYIFSNLLKNAKLKFSETDNHLELVALATVADLVPLTGANRNFVYFGLKRLQKTKRQGLLSLIEKANIKKEEIGVYEIGHIIAPRLNAMGRLENAMDSLRLICTPNIKRAEKLADLLSNTNFERQQITLKTVEHAKGLIGEKSFDKLIFIADESYKEGIVGLVAGRLVEEYYLPSIVISKGKKYSKASARSVKGFNITEFLRTASDLLVDVGGHPMAAGFTVETEKLALLEQKLFAEIEKLITKKHLERSLRIDLELSSDLISQKTYQEIQQLAPFGMGNPEPVFLTKEFEILDTRIVGNDGQHLKLKLGKGNLLFDAIAFGLAGSNLKIGDKANVVYMMSLNEWNGNKRVELKIKDIKKS